MKTSSEFDWALLRSFLAVLDNGTLLGAARQLGNSQPTVGRHVEALERQLGAALFERTGRGLAPTALALGIAEPARRMEESAADVTRTLAGQDAQEQGTVRITASQLVAAYLLPPILAGLRAEAPGIEIEVVASNRVSNLLRREADIAIRMVRPEQSSIVARKLGTLSMVACAQRGYLARCGTPKRAEDLLRHDLIGYDTDTGILRGFAALGFQVTPAAFKLRSDDQIVVWQMIRAGLGIGFIGRFVAETDADVRIVLPRLAIPSLPVWLAVHREIRSSRRIRLVYDYLAETLGQSLR